MILITKPNKLEYKDNNLFLYLKNKPYPLYVKAIWFLLRLQHKGKINNEIKEEKKKPNFDFKEFAYKKITEKRKLQFIIKKNYIIAIATLNHPIYKPEEIYKNKELIEIPHLQGKLMKIKEENEITYYLKIDAGDVFTTQAITLSKTYKIFDFYISTQPTTRITRCEINRDLKETINKAIEQSINKIKLSKIPQNKTYISDKKAKEILRKLIEKKAISDTIMEECWEKYQTRGNSIYDLALACGYVSSFGKSFYKNSKSRQKLSLVAGEILEI